MKIFNNTNITNNFKRSALAIGNFDGIHIGHQKVFQKTKKFANKALQKVASLKKRKEKNAKKLLKQKKDKAKVIKKINKKL